MIITEEQDLLEEGMATLAEFLPEVGIRFERTPVKRTRYDAIVTLRVGENRITLSVEVKQSAKRIVWGQLLNQLTDAKNPTLLTDYINPVLGKKLRTQGINYMDTVGNIYLRVETGGLPLLIWIEGRKPIRQLAERADHAFTKAGLRVTFGLLAHPDWANETVRTIAQEVGTGLETVLRAKSSLQQRGFLKEVRQGEWKLVNRKALLDKWIEAYATRLQPGLLLGRYRLPNGKSIADWQGQCLASPQTQWGGEPAADGLTDFLRPAEWVLYTRQPAREVMKQLRLLPDPGHGSVRLYNKFWPHDEPGNAVSPLLVYADLLISGDPRNAEIAQKILDTHVQSLLD
ncbi:hypothetical protein GCM10027578_27640 [Spirosoma luteolum]